MLSKTGFAATAHNGSPLQIQRDVAPDLYWRPEQREVGGLLLPCFVATSKYRKKAEYIVYPCILLPDDPKEGSARFAWKIVCTDKTVLEDEMSTFSCSKRAHACDWCARHDHVLVLATSR